MVGGAAFGVSTNSNTGLLVDMAAGGEGGEGIRRREGRGGVYEEDTAAFFLFFQGTRGQTGMQQQLRARIQGDMVRIKR